MTSLYILGTSSDDLSQGDILFDVPVFNLGIEEIESLPDFSFESLEGRVTSNVDIKGLIIMSQACDLANEPERNRKPIESVVCASIYPISRYSKDLISQTNSKTRPGYYLLHKEDGALENSYIIDFYKLHTISYQFLSQFSKKQTKRIRPNNPYLEQISHHFGNFFSRVGSDFERPKKDLQKEFDYLLPMDKHYEELYNEVFNDQNPKELSKTHVGLEHLVDEFLDAKELPEKYKKLTELKECLSD